MVYFSADLPGATKSVPDGEGSRTRGLGDLERGYVEVERPEEGQVADGEEGVRRRRRWRDSRCECREVGWESF